MTTRISIVLLLILIGVGAASAQTVEQRVGKIRQTYAEVNKRIEAGAEDQTDGFHYAAWTVGGDRDGQRWSAVGTMKTSDEYWFDGDPNRDGDKVRDARKSIRKIISSYAGAADLRTRSEYLFDENTGELIFAFTTELDPEQKTLERRFYYQKNKLIRMTRDNKNFDRAADIGAEDRQLAANQQSDAKRLQNLFALMFAEE